MDGAIGLVEWASSDSVRVAILPLGHHALADQRQAMGSGPGRPEVEDAA